MFQNTQVAQHDTPAAPRQATAETVRRKTIAPAVDIYEDAQAVTLFADLPGVPREKLDIRVHDGHLTIEAVPAEVTPSNVRVSYAEERVPFFARRFVVSDDFDTSRIEANLKDGVLKLTIPRREAAKPRQIQVNIG
ncbi:HSP20 family protein [Pararobbsia alpina]|uniref:Hsp20/alpha crystallin family protein n=1 Tax=Pararobbsia alpina TaxID=621374 RepID=UPI0039A59AE3